MIIKRLLHGLTLSESGVEQKDQASDQQETEGKPDGVAGCVLLALLLRHQGHVPQVVQCAQQFGAQVTSPVSCHLNQLQLCVCVCVWGGGGRKRERDRLCVCIYVFVRARARARVCVCVCVCVCSLTCLIVCAHACHSNVDRYYCGL